MNDSNRPVNTFYAFCSLILPGLGQLLQKRFGAAIGFFVLFLLSGFLPVLIVSTLFMDRFSYQPLRIHLLHIFTFGGLYFVFLLAIFWSVLDAARKPGEIQDENRQEKLQKSSHFTIVELLVVIAIIGILIALLLPSVPAARGAARRMECCNNMKHIMLGLTNYSDKYGCFPPAYTVDEGGKPLHSWRVLILPYVEQNELYEKIRLNEPWDSEYNRQFYANAPKIYRCPSGNPRETPPVPVPTGSYYSVIDGPEAAFSGCQAKTVTAKEQKDAVFLVERRMPVNWMDPSREISFDTACKGVNVDAMGISSYHADGANVVMGDGAARFIPNDINSETLRKMLTFHKN